MKLPFGRKKSSASEAETKSAAISINLAKPLDDSGTMQPFWYISENCEANPTGLALIGTDVSLTNAEYLSLVKRTAQVLRSRGVKPGDIVAVSVNNDSNFILMGALLHEAAVGCTVPSFSQLPDWVTKVVSSRLNTPILPSRLIQWDSTFEADVEQASGQIEPRIFPSADSLCRMVFSSGTTGLPKAIPFSVATLQSRAKSAHRNWMPVTPFLSLIPLSGVSGTLAATYSLLNGKTFLSSSLKQNENLPLIDSQSVSCIKGSPMQLEALLHEAKKAGKKLQSLKIIQSAGSMLPNALATELHQYFGAQIRNLFGATECGTIVVRTGNFDNPSLMGHVLPEANLEVVDESGLQLPAGTPGVIRWRTKDQIVGYYKSPTATLEHFRDGWFYSGDEGYLTDDGQLYLTGRSNELINLGGRKVNPAYLDDLIKSQENIVDAACFAFNDGSAIPQLGLAIVVSGPVDRQAIETAFLKEHAALRPAAVIRVNEIPRGALDKVKRRELAAQVEAKLRK